jgi:hypothetical protein
MWPDRKNPGELVCGYCQDQAWLAKRKAEHLEKIGAWSWGVCIEAGMRPREARSEVGKIPVEIKRALPIEAVKSMLEGKPPKAGFGIGGEGTGGGKTSAMAAILRAYLQAREVARVNEGGEPNPCPGAAGLRWRSWPSTVALLRSRATVDGFVETTVNDMIQADILFLDDLGSERIKGSYVEDFAASQLDVVVDERYRREAPTFYTTNLDMGGLIEFYGARLVSRLCGDNPLVIVTGLKDQRFK